ncbi:MAG: arylsulfotransferase family protein, partial [Eubacterium sp.]|nr:arylsulfotransferase family protein [Eubacterium sp.]
AGSSKKYTFSGTVKKVSYKADGKKKTGYELVLKKSIKVKNKAGKTTTEKRLQIKMKNSSETKKLKKKVGKTAKIKGNLIQGKGSSYFRDYCIKNGVLVTSSSDPTPTPVIAEGLPDFKVTGETDLPGHFYLSFPYSRNLVMMDGKGNIIWSKHEDNPVNGQMTGFWDFKKHKIGNKTYYSYHDQTGEYDYYGLDGFGPGERVILDENFKEIKRIKLEESDVVEKGHPLDGHDFLLIDLDHYIMSAYIKDTVYNVPGHESGSSVVYSYLQEVKDGKVVWDFKSIDYPELYALTVNDGLETANDYANEKTDAPDIIHFNSMRLNDDGNLVCSFRHICSIMCLDRTKRENQILWKLSGAGDEFGLTEEQKTSCQHYATVDGDTITVFDNGNKTARTRVCVYTIDPENKKLKSFCSYQLEGKRSEACGDAIRISGDTFAVGWGKALNDATCFSVVDFITGKEIFKIDNSNPQNFSYRCVYCE